MQLQVGESGIPNTLEASNGLDPLIAKECCNLANAFREKELDTFQPHQPTDCAVEIVLGLNCHSQRYTQ